MYVCVYIYEFVCVFVCICVWIGPEICMYVCEYNYIKKIEEIHEYMNTCTHAHTYIHTYIQVLNDLADRPTGDLMTLCVCMLYVCMYTCMCKASVTRRGHTHAWISLKSLKLYIYIYIYIHINTCMRTVEITQARSGRYTACMRSLKVLGTFLILQQVPDNFGRHRAGLRLLRNLRTRTYSVKNRCPVQYLFPGIFRERPGRNRCPVQYLFPGIFRERPGRALGLCWRICVCVYMYIGICTCVYEYMCVYVYGNVCVCTCT